MFTAFLSIAVLAYQTGKNEDEYDPIRDVDDAKGYQKANPERVAIYTATAKSEVGRKWEVGKPGNANYEYKMVKKETSQNVQYLKVLTIVSGCSSGNVELGRMWQWRLEPLYKQSRNYS